MTKTKEYKTINPSLTGLTGAGMSRADLPPLPPPPPSRYNNNNNRRRGNGRYQNNNAHNNAHNNARTTTVAAAAAAPPAPLFAAPVRKIPVVVHKKKEDVIEFEYNTNTSAVAAPPRPPPPTPLYDPTACDAYLTDGVVTEAVCSEHVVRRLCDKTPVEEIEWSGALAEAIRRCPGRPQGIIEAVVDHMEGRGFPDIVTSVFDTLIRYEIVEGDAFVDWRESETRRRVVIQTSDWIMRLVEKMNDEYDDDDDDDEYDDDHR
jgi:hypothetical protein